MCMVKAFKILSLSSEIAVPQCSFIQFLRSLHDVAHNGCAQGFLQIFSILIKAMRANELWVYVQRKLSQCDKGSFVLSYLF